MATIKIDKVVAFIPPEQFDAAKWCYPIAEEPIEAAQLVFVNYQTERASLWRVETLVPPDGVAINTANIGDAVSVAAKYLPDEVLILVFPIENQLVD